MSKMEVDYSFQINEIKDYVENNLGALPPVRHFKKKYKDKYINIQRAFKKNVRLSVSAYSLKIRMEKAKELLQSMLCEEVAQAVGYQSTHFTLAFKKYFGKTPAEVKYGTKDGYKNVERDNLVEQVKQYVDEHIDENPTFYKLAPLFNIAKADLKKAFITHMGMSLSGYIGNKQIERAKSYLLSGKTVNEVTEIMQYKNVSNFSLYFKRVTGQSPSQYYKNMIGNSIRTQQYRKLTEKDILDVEVFIRGNLGDKDIENSIRVHFQLPIYLIDDGFKQYRSHSLNENVLHERLKLAVRMLNDNISINNIKDIVGFNSEKDLLLSLLREGKASASMLSKKTELGKHIISEKIFKDLLKRYCYQHINSFPKDEAVSSFLNIPIQEFKILRQAYLNSSLVEHFDSIKMGKAKELLQEGMLAKSICIKLGYTYSNELSTKFKKHVGLTIQEYVRSLDLHPQRMRPIDKNTLIEVEESVRRNYLKKKLVNILKRTYGNRYRAVSLKFKKDYRKTPLEFARELRMGKAKELLISGRSAEEVAKILGYSQVSSFSTEFRKHFGATPFYSKPVKNVGRKPKEPKVVVFEFRKYVRKHIDEPLSFTRIAEKLGIAKENLKKAYTIVYGNEIEAYIEKARVERAKFLIRKGHKIIEVARIMHYADGTTFAAFFKKEIGMTATEYLSSIKKNQK